jgi:hypothetical protein
MDGPWPSFAWSMGISHRNINPETLHVSMGGELLKVAQALKLMSSRLLKLDIFL